MDDVRKYRIRMRGQADEAELNDRSPLRLQVESSDANTTEVSLAGDQTAVIGVIRYLHSLGYVLLLVDGSALDTLQ